MSAEIFAFTASFFLLFLILELVRRRQLSENYSLIWLFTAIAILLLSLIREFLDLLARLMGIFYPPAALFVLSFGFMFLILIQFSIVITRLTKKNKELAQEIALIRWEMQQSVETAVKNKPDTAEQDDR